jgi:hypothetical protein
LLDNSQETATRNLVFTSLDETRRRAIVSSQNVKPAFLALRSSGSKPRTWLC